jgi:hypothetical protein
MLVTVTVDVGPPATSPPAAGPPAAGLLLVPAAPRSALYDDRPPPSVEPVETTRTALGG